MLILILWYNSSNDTTNANRCTNNKKEGKPYFTVLCIASMHVTSLPSVATTPSAFLFAEQAGNSPCDRNQLGTQWVRPP